MTKKVTARPYRAPEVALDESYGVEIDMWALGVILAEMIICSIENKRELLFRAEHCYPISPFE